MQVIELSPKIFMCCIVVAISACATQPQEKPNLPEKSSIKNVLIIKNNSGVPIQGATIVARYIDLADAAPEKDGMYSKLTSNTKEITCKTDNVGACLIDVPVKLAHHEYSNFNYLIPPGSSKWCIDDCLVTPPRRDTVGDIFTQKISSISTTTQTTIENKIWTQAESRAWGYASYISFSAFGGGLFGLLGSHDVGYKNSEGELVNKIQVQGSSVQEFFCDQLRLDANKSLADGLVQWSNELSGSLASARADIPRRGGLCVNRFKDKDYAAITLIASTRYNSARLNDYGIGVNVFDEMVREILNPLGASVKALNFYGYDIKVKAYRENFASPSNSIEKKNLEFRFLIPKDIAAMYKDKDLTGQQVIDRSYVLLNDERIDLKLQ